MSNAKLVRDRIPDIIKAAGETCVIRPTDDGAEYHEALVDKLQEECTEYAESEEIEELADILEVIRYLAMCRGTSLEHVYSLMLRKRAIRGGFEFGYIMEIG